MVLETFSGMDNPFSMLENLMALLRMRSRIAPPSLPRTTGRGNPTHGAPAEKNARDVEPPVNTHATHMQFLTHTKPSLKLFNGVRGTGCRHGKPNYPRELVFQRDQAESHRRPGRARRLNLRDNERTSPERSTAVIQLKRTDAVHGAQKEQVFNSNGNTPRTRTHATHDCYALLPPKRA